MIKRFIKYYKPHLPLFTLDMVCALIIAICDLFYPTIAGRITVTKNLNFVIVWSVALLGIFVLKACLNYIVDYLGHFVGVKIQSDMRRDLFKKLQTMPFTFYDEQRTGSLMSRLTSDLFEVSELAHHGPEDLFLSLVTLVGSLVLVAFINLWLALIIFVCLPIIIFLAVKLRLAMVKGFRFSREKMAEINSTIESSISGIRVAKSYVSEAHELEKFDESNLGLMNARKMQYKYMSRFHTVLMFCMDMLYLIALLFGGIFYCYKLIEIDGLTAYVLYVTMITNPIKRFINFFEQLQNGMTGFERFTEIMDTPSETEPQNPISVDKLKGDIKFENVSFTYNKFIDNHSNYIVLKNLNLTVEAGKSVALVGQSGGGKTTLCNLLPRFYNVNSGKITIDGIDVAQINSKDLRRNIGIVAQDVYIFSGTIKENILFGNFDATDEEIIEACKMANIHDFILTTEKGYDTYVGERGVKLSGGQKQRISIARAFLKNPPILILDEATSALDNVTEMQIKEALDKLSSGRTTIIVAHRLSTVKNADEIIVISKNGVEERGTHSSLLEKNGIYATLYNYQYKSIN